MMVFDTTENLIDHIKLDRTKASLSPVRFINVDALSDWAIMKKTLFELTHDHMLLSEFCDGEDLMPNFRRMITELKKCSCDVCVLPISETHKVFPDKTEDIINRILTVEYFNFYRENFRIYFLTYRMRYALEEISHKNDLRKKDAFLFLNSSTVSDEFSLTIVNDSLGIPAIKGEITGFKRYLKYWEQNPNKPIILRTGAARFIDSAVLRDNVIILNSPYDYIKREWMLPAEIKEDFGSAEEWRELAGYCLPEKNMETTFCGILNVNRFSESLFGSWSMLNDFKRWVLWLWSKTKDCTGYFKQCVKTSASIESFEECIYCEIISVVELPVYQSYYEQRRQLLSEMKLSPPLSFFRQIDNLKKFKALKTLTDLSESEREKIIELTAGMEEYFYEPTYDLLKTIYPGLFNYLDNPGMMPEKIESYYKWYKWHKVTNTITKGFYETVCRIAREKGADVYSLRSRNELISEAYKDNSAIYFIDCMGAEYLNLLISILSKLKDRFECAFYVGYCALPSSSEFNRDFLNDRNVVENSGLLDSFKHIMPDHITGLMHEMAFFDGLSEKIEKSFDDKTDRVILTSDHGSSRLAVLARQTEFDFRIDPGDSEICEYGRYCIGTELENELSTAVNYDGKLIFADYSRFTQKGTPTYEMHGGASLEEWLVPVIVIDRKQTNMSVPAKQIGYSIQVLTPTVKKNIKSGAVTVKFKLTPMTREDVYVTVNGKKSKCVLEDDVYLFEYRPSIKETGVHASAHIGNTEIQFDFKIAKPISQNSGFNI